MKAIIFLLKTKQPVLATSFEGDPNSDVSYSYIPGSMIRGFLIGRYLQRNPQQNADILNNEIIRNLFFNGNVCYLNAYPSSQEGKRTFPTLLPWKKQKGAELNEKDDEIDIYDFSVAKPSKDELDSPKSIDKSYWVEEGGYIRLYNVERRINLHNFRNRCKGRSTNAEGEIFRYDAIDAGQTFQGVILCQKAEEELIKVLLQPSDIWLGGSRSAGYGHCEIIEVKSHDNCSDIEESAENRVNKNILKITLLSDLIIRDECGQYAAISPTKLLSKTLDISLSKPKLAYMDSTYIGGFNRKWGLPLPQVQAVKAGSVFVYENIKLTSEQISQLEIKGIGERRVEGFGRIAVNWRINDNIFSAKKPETDRTLYTARKQPRLKTQESQNLAHQMAERILRKKLEQLLLEKIQTNKLIPNEMSNSQLSRLMIVARQALDRNHPQPLDNLLNQLNYKARGQYESTKINKQSLQETIKNWLKEPHEWMGTDIKEVVIADETCIISDKLAMEYTLRLIMAIAKNSIKEKADD